MMLSNDARPEFYEKESFKKRETLYIVQKNTSITNYDECFIMTDKSKDLSHG